MANDEPLHTMILFGASGDLTQRKLLPALFRLCRANRLPPRFRLVGYGRSDLTDEIFREEAKKSLAEHFPRHAAACNGFLDCLSYVKGGYDDDEGMARLRDAIRCSECDPPIYYLALPPSAAGEVLKRFAEGKLPSRNARIMMEKPFGMDFESARDLNRLLGQCFQETNIHRIDHYLAKDTVRNLLFFRFANLLFEPIWNHHYIDHIQVSATETIGVENRGGFYDGVGVVRDMIQNHVLLLLAFATMEPPRANDPESIRDRTADLLQSINPPQKGDFVFGQYDGYRDAKGVAPDSTTPTFAAIRLFIHNWRWYNVPIYLMSGKGLDRRVSEVAFIFKKIPMRLLEADSDSQLAPNILTLRIHPDEGIRLSLGVKAPGFQDRVAPASLDFRYPDLLPSLPAGERELFTGYERVLLEAFTGRPGLSWRADAIESAWKVVEPILAEESEMTGLMRYAPGSSGARLAEALLQRDRRTWHTADF